MLYQLLLFVVATPPLAQTLVSEETAQPWPEVTTDTLEEAVRRAESAFLARLEYFQVHELEDGRVEASVRLVAERAAWGDVPFTLIELQRRAFSLTYFGNDTQPWRLLPPPAGEGARMPILLLTSGSGAELEILHVIFAEREGGRPPIEDLVRVRGLEFEHDSGQLREKLIEDVIAPESSELLWSYALRRLYRLEDDPDRQFDLVLHPRIQEAISGGTTVTESFSPVRRLAFATGLLTGRGGCCPESYRLVRLSDGGYARERVSREKRRTMLLKLLGIFEQASSADMADAALGNFVAGSAKRAQFTDEQWREIRARIRKAVENPNHPIHKQPAERQPGIDRILKRVLREPNPFAPEK